MNLKLKLQLFKNKSDDNDNDVFSPLFSRVLETHFAVL